MHASPLLDTEVVNAALPDPAAVTPATVRAVSSSMRGLTLSFDLNTSDEGAESAAASPVVLHVSFQGFLDALWVLVTEDAACAPGVVMVNEGLPEQLRAASAHQYRGETPSVECEVLLGLRDHPLTNLVASTIAHAVRRFGETRALVMCISVAQTAKQLRDTDEKRRFLVAIKDAVMTLASGSGESVS